MQNIFALDSRRYLVIKGKIVKGIVKKGMHISIADKRILISGLEIIDSEKTGWAGLVIIYKSIKEKKELEQLLNRKRELNII